MWMVVTQAALAASVGVLSCVFARALRATRADVARTRVAVDSLRASFTSFQRHANDAFEVLARSAVAHAHPASHGPDADGRSLPPAASTPAPHRSESPRKAPSSSPAREPGSARPLPVSKPPADELAIGGPVAALPAPHHGIPPPPPLPGSARRAVLREMAFVSHLAALNEAWPEVAAELRGAIATGADPRRLVGWVTRVPGGDRRAEILADAGASAAAGDLEAGVRRQLEQPSPPGTVWTLVHLATGDRLFAVDLTTGRPRP